MSTKNRGNISEVPAAAQAPTGDGNTAVVTPVTPNYTLHYRRDHPQDRCSFGVAGVPGIVVWPKGMFANGVPPSTITTDVELAQPKASVTDAKAAKAAERAAKLEERATKARERVEAQAAKAAERQAKATAALEAARAKAATAVTPSQS